MAKNMARLKDGIVINIEWCSDKTEETDILKNCSDLFIEIGDYYVDGAFFRDGEQVLSPIVSTQTQTVEMSEYLEILGVEML